MGVRPAHVTGSPLSAKDKSFRCFTKLGNKTIGAVQRGVTQSHGPDTDDPPVSQNLPLSREKKVAQGEICKRKDKMISTSLSEELTTLGYSRLC